MKRACCIVASLGLFVGACASDEEPEQVKLVGQPITRDITQASFFPADPQELQRDAVPEQPYLIQLVAYRITLPAGAVSKSDDFWKHINEQAVDVGTYERLLANGMRCGVAAATEWDYIKGILDKNPAQTQRTGFTGRDARGIDLEMKKGIEYQNVFAFDTSGQLAGRTYERCDNLLRLSFMPAPRKHGSARIAVCPVVKSLRERLVPIGDVSTRRIERVYPEHLYDLNLVVYVSIDSFLVIAPSPDLQLPLLGKTFLVNDGPTEQTETLLVFRPIIFRQRAEDPKQEGGPAVPGTPGAPAGPELLLPPDKTPPAADGAAPAQPAPDGSGTK